MPGRRPGPGDDTEDRDPGLARERTDLAWTRTAVSVGALGAAMLRSSPAAGATVLAAAAAVWLLGQLSARASQPAPAAPRLSHRRVLALITAGTTTVAALALLLTLLSPGSGRS